MEKRDPIVNRWLSGRAGMYEILDRSVDRSARTRDPSLIPIPIVRGVGCGSFLGAAAASFCFHFILFQPFMSFSPKKKRVFADDASNLIAC